MSKITKYLCCYIPKLCWYILIEHYWIAFLHSNFHKNSFFTNIHYSLHFCKCLHWANCLPNTFIFILATTHLSQLNCKCKLWTAPSSIIENIRLWNSMEAKLIPQSCVLYHVTDKTFYPVLLFPLCQIK